MGEPIKSYCLRCDYETNHEILFKEHKRGGEDYDYLIVYYVIKCSGCDRISFREEFHDFEAAYPDHNGNWVNEVTIETYPKKLQVTKRLNDTFILPKKVKGIYEEAINAFNAECFILTGVAFRAVIEAICLEENIAGRNLERKINNLVRRKLITEKEANRLHSIRFIGNDSVHEMSIPKERSLTITLHIIEHLLDNLYLIDYSSDGHIETIINDFKQFMNLLSINIKGSNKGEEIPLAKIFGKNVRRFNGKLNEFEKELIAQINKGEYKELKIGKIDIYGNGINKVQHFIIN